MRTQCIGRSEREEYRWIQGLGGTVLEEWGFAQGINRAVW